MELITWIGLALAAVVGGTLGTLVTHLRYRLRRAEERSQTELEMATLKERLQGREVAIVQLEQTLSRTSYDLDQASGRVAEAQAENAKLSAVVDQLQRQNEEHSQMLNTVEKRFTDTFKALSADALQATNTSFMELARNLFTQFNEGMHQTAEKRENAMNLLVNPLQQSLQIVQQKIDELEKQRLSAYEGLQTHVKSLVDTQQQLRSETANLVRALRAPATRGRWGEIQLRRVVEMAGMLNHCDFYEQQSMQTEGGLRRPDLVVKLPGDKNIVVDAKVPLSSYLEAIESTCDEVRAEKMAEHAGHVRRHIQALSQKSYWDQFQPAPEFVVLFLPGETFFSAALEADPTLLEVGVSQRVILATPTTLIALLRSVAYGWRQENLAANARQISELGKQLYQRLSGLGSYLNDLGRHLGSTVQSYNKTVANLESRVLVSARRFKDLQADDPEKEIPELADLDTQPRVLRGAELDQETALQE